uniref:Uncharacterized protein n=1 Tax=Panagrellus redivivus TaxID=6233 RepID=A0A7E4V9W3_PANRE
MLKRYVRLYSSWFLMVRESEHSRGTGHLLQAFIVIRAYDKSNHDSIGTRQNNIAPLSQGVQLGNEATSAKKSLCKLRRTEGLYHIGQYVKARANISPLTSREDPDRFL